jgi:hypothetical protein
MISLPRLLPLLVCLPLSAVDPAASALLKKHCVTCHGETSPAYQSVPHLAICLLVKRLKEIDEGGQSILDSSILPGGSNLFDGDAHSADEMPLLLYGRGNGTIKPGGRILNYLDKGEDNRRACSL